MEEKIVKDRETKVSEEGIKSTHTEYKGGRVDCQVTLPCLRVRHKINGRPQNATWPKVNGVYVPMNVAKQRLEAVRQEEEEDGKRDLQSL